MKLLLDFLPIGLFFIVYKTVGLYAAIYVMIAASAIQMVFYRWKMGKFEKIQVVTLALLVIFGGITLVFRNPAFLMWKVSVLYVVFALALVGSLWIGEKTLLQRMFGKELKLPSLIWRRITWFWGAGFVAIAILNGYFVRLALSTRELLFASTTLDKKIELTELECVTTTAEQLCKNAQQTEQAWVNFKLFGTMGLTFVLILITVVFISKHIKEKNE